MAVWVRAPRQHNLPIGGRPIAWLTRVSHPPLCPGSVAGAAGVLPPREDLGEWLGALVERDGLEVLLRALVERVGRDRLMAAVEKECDVRWGIEPVITGDSGQQVGVHCPIPNA